LLRKQLISLFVSALACKHAAAADRFVTTPAQLQQALNDAVGGDTITLQAGVTFPGSFQLPPRSAGTDWITLRSSNLDKLPPAGSRVRAVDAVNMPRLLSVSGNAVLTAGQGAHHYRIVGIELTVSPGVYTLGLVLLGTAYETSVDQLPHHIRFERVYVHGDETVGGKRGIALNCGASTVIDSRIANFKSTSQDTQAIAGWNGPGPYTIVNNYLEASGEAVIFGGAEPSITGNVPSDIRISGNRFNKPPAWFGQPWAVKNLLELKNARRVNIDGNLFENNWAAAQNGFAILFTPRADSGPAPVVQDVTVTNNIIRHTPGAFNIDGYDVLANAGATDRILIRNNLLADISGTAFQILNGARNVTIDHNTSLQKGFVISFDGPRPDASLVFTNNIVTNNQYGIFGAGRGTGNPALAQYSPGAIVTANALVGGMASQYPAGNFFPDSLLDIGFVDLTAGNYALAPGSLYISAGTDGKPLGADLSKLPR
jgi:hypothetical protein